MSAARGLMAGVIAILLAGCATTRSLECSIDPDTGLMRCTEVIDVIRH